VDVAAAAQVTGVPDTQLTSWAGRRWILNAVAAQQPAGTLGIVPDDLGALADITVGDALELMGREAESFTCPIHDHKVFYRMLRELGAAETRRPNGGGRSAPQAPSHRTNSSAATSRNAAPSSGIGH
jgi:hypothetical protein